MINDEKIKKDIRSFNDEKDARNFIVVHHDIVVWEGTASDEDDAIHQAANELVVVEVGEDGFEK